MPIHPRTFLVAIPLSCILLIGVLSWIYSSIFPIYIKRFRWEQNLSNWVFLNIWLATHLIQLCWRKHSAALKLPLQDTARVCSSWSECRAEGRLWSILTGRATPSTAETSSQKHGCKNCRRDSEGIKQQHHSLHANKKWPSANGWLI